MKMKSIDLNKYFTDTESAQLDFKATSSDPTVASVATSGVLPMGMLKVTGKKAGTATITVHAHDNVNDPVPGTIAVTVANLNSAPTGIVPTSETKKLAAILYKTNGQLVRTISAATNPGPAGTTTDSVKAVVKYWPTTVLAAARVSIADGTAGAPANEVKAADAKVSVSIMPGTKAGTWDVTMTPNKEGKETVVVYFEDVFGSSVMAGEFVAHVNTVPKLAAGNPMEDITLYHDGQTTGSRLSAVTFTIADHFDGIAVLDGMNTADPPAAVRDVSCSVTTTQPISESGHVDSGDDVTATVTAAHMAEVTLNHVQGSTFTPTTADVDVLNTVAVNAASATGAAAQGQFVVTITCEDDELSVHDSATITVR